VGGIHKLQRKIFRSSLCKVVWVVGIHHIWLQRNLRLFNDQGIMQGMVFFFSFSFLVWYL
jgi:hypothetical protein